MPIDYADSAQYRWLQKEVHESRLLDDMEDLDHWDLENWAEGRGQIELSSERVHQGNHSIRLRSVTTGEKPGPTPGRPFGAASLVRRFNRENWSSFNRISYWVYPDLPGFRVITLQDRLTNDGPPSGDQRELGYIIVRNRTWNHVVWEVPDLPRDAVTALSLTYRLQGSEPGATGTATFYFDALELQRVTADHNLGWAVAPGRIAYSHTGYLTKSKKTALAADLPAKEFRLVNQASGLTAFRGPVQTVSSPIGAHQLMDFSRLQTPGHYVLVAGARATRPFRIGDHIWDRTIWKAINFFYCERCGARIPGIHGACHRDWQVAQDGHRILINGGWHDAGDLSQGLVNTGEAVYAMLGLACSLGETSRYSSLRERLLEEAGWGLDWVLNTTFHNGSRAVWATMDFWTDGILGTADDVVADARNEPMPNFVAAAAEARSARLLGGDRPSLKRRCLRTAIEDWRYGLEGMGRRPLRNQLETSSYGALASIELYLATRENRFLDTAVELAQTIVASQERKILYAPGGAITGYFYTSPEHERIQHYQHRGHEQAPIEALSRLCELLPGHPGWMSWYATVVLHSEFFQKSMARFTAPYALLPNSVYRSSEIEQAAEDQRLAWRNQIENGFHLGSDSYLRVFPVQPGRQFRGNYGTLLAQARAVSLAARLRRRPDLAQLVQRQLEWVVGRNPFAQSTMYGEGHDFAPQYTAMSGDIVGSLPVGIKSAGDTDTPFWPATNCWNFKEVWVHPVSHWLALMGDTVPRSGAEAGRCAVLALEGQTGPGGTVELKGKVNGRGIHTLTIQAANLEIENSHASVNLTEAGSAAVSWTGKLIVADGPWVALLSSDCSGRERVEAFGLPRRATD